jgi:hypothetical protein
VWQTASATPVKTIWRTGGEYGLELWRLKNLVKMLTFCGREYGLRGCHNVLSGSIWQWMQVAIEICWNPLDSATQVFKKRMTSLSLPPPSLSLSCFLFSFHNFLFCFLLLITPFIFCEEISVKRSYLMQGLNPRILRDRRVFNPLSHGDLLMKALSSAPHVKNDREGKPAITWTNVCKSIGVFYERGDCQYFQMHLLAQRFVFWG